MCDLRVRVSAPSRLHLGDIDPFGIGRFGYAPLLAIDAPRTIVDAADAEGLEVKAEGGGEAEGYARRVVEALSLPGANVSVPSTPPRHSGFGSTTSLALSIGKAVAMAYSRDVDALQLLKMTGRTSTGGVHTFQSGGFALTGGLKVKLGEPLFEREQPLYPPLIVRLQFPEDWRFVLVTPRQAKVGPHGDSEEETFRSLRVRKPPTALIHKAYFIVASKMVPAILEENPKAFGEALTEVQVTVGKIYEPVQGSIFNPSSQWIIPHLKSHGALGLGQSSWGPTVYAFLDGDGEALKMKSRLEKELKRKASISVARPDNVGVIATRLD